MLRYRMSERAGTRRAPREFVEALRRETRNPLLDVWWSDDTTTFAPAVAGVFTAAAEGEGCWVVWEKHNVLEHVMLPTGESALVSRQRFIDVMRLDGMWGNPRVLGPWVAKALNKSTLKGRARELDDLNEADVLRADNAYAERARDFARDSAVRRVFARAADERGTPITLREERVRFEAAARKREERSRRRLEQQARSMRLQGTV